MGIREILAKTKSAIEFMYDDEATIKRFVDYTKPNGSDGKRWEAVHEEVPCHLSSVKLDNTKQSDGNVIEYDEKLFLSIEYPVLPGDKIEVNGILYESAKKPLTYTNHQEVLLHTKGYA